MESSSRSGRLGCMINMTDRKIIEIFLASSSELREDRDQFRIFISEKNNEYIEQNIFLKLVLWEDFLDAMSRTSLQDEYNKAITKCHVFVSLFKTKVGQYTEEEFDHAFGAFKENNRPLIYTYFKDSLVRRSEINKNIYSLIKFKDKLSDLGHFYTYYDNINELKYKFEQQLHKFIPMLTETQISIDDKYLEFQSYRCINYIIEGLKQYFIPQLDKVFVPLAFYKSSNLILKRSDLSSDNLALNSGQVNTLEIWDLLRSGITDKTYRRLLIKSQGGYGKTTLLRHVAYIYTQKRQRKDVPELLPVFLRLRDWQTEITQENPNLPTLIEKFHLPKLQKFIEGDNLTLPFKWAENHLINGKMLILWDGFDEVRPEWRESVSKWLGQQMSDYPNSFFILTSRPKGYNEGYSSEHKPHATLFIKKFDTHQIKDFIERWYFCQESFAMGRRETPDVIEEAKQNAANLWEQLEERRELLDLATNPLLLNMIAKIHRFYPRHKLPQHRTELYQKIFRLQLEARPEFRRIEMLLEASDSQPILQGLALYMVRKNTTTLENKEKDNDNELQREVQNNLARQNISVNCKDFIKEIVERAELLVNMDDSYEFAHLSFQCYLAAKEILETKNENLIVSHCLYSDIWRETTRLYAGLLKNPISFLHRLLQIKTQEATDLAYECLKETTREIDLETISDEIQKARYQRLEELLRNQDFQEADNETYRVMLQTVGKEGDQPLVREDLNNFPCKDLFRINELWEKYSDGKFGFRTQTQIWFDCGGEIWKFDEDRRILNQFWTAVRWGEPGTPIFQLEDVPPGHLPHRVFMEFREINLMSRFGHCVGDAGSG